MHDHQAQMRRQNCTLVQQQQPSSRPQHPCMEQACLYMNNPLGIGQHPSMTMHTWRPWPARRTFFIIHCRRFSESGFFKKKFDWFFALHDAVLPVIRSRPSVAQRICTVSACDCFDMQTWWTSICMQIWRASFSHIVVLSTIFPERADKLKLDAPTTVKRYHANKSG